MNAKRVEKSHSGHNPDGFFAYPAGMEILNDLWQRTPPLRMTMLYEAIFVLAVFAVLSDAPDGPAMGLSAVGVALLLKGMIQMPDRAAWHRFVQSAPAWVPRVAGVLAVAAALCAVFTPAQVVMLAYAGALVLGYGWTYTVALGGDLARTKWIPCHWLRHPKYAATGLAIWSFWRLVFALCLFALALAGDDAMFVVTALLGAPVLAKLVDMTVLLKILADNGARD